VSAAAVDASVLYEVCIDLDAAVEPEYRAWLRGHVDELLALPGFVEAQVFDVLDPAPAAGRVALCMQYRLRDAAALQDYFDQHAPRLRGEGVARFGGRFVATRRVLRRAQR
jgi:hypothetical protein